MRKFEQYQDMIARLFPELGDVESDERILSRPVTFQVTDDCNLACFVAGTKILMSDFSYKNIEDVKVGDVVMAFDEHTEPNKQLKLKPTKVTHTFYRHDKVRKIRAVDGSEIVCTDEHPFLDGRKKWKRAEALTDTDTIWRYRRDKNCVFEEKISFNKPLSDDVIPVYNLETELHTYIANDFLVHNCTYCYQINKGKRRMSFETAKKFIDLLISGDKGMSTYINPTISPALIVEFIGGEPFLEVDLIDQICDYLEAQLAEKMHPWATKHMFSICSNGVLYFDERVQKFLHKHRDNLSFSVTIDGNKELHDSCRVFHNGQGSYDLAVAAAQDWMSRGYYMGSKITIAPGNLQYVYDAIMHMVDLGYEDINANCVYEEGWTQEHAVEFYKQLKRVADGFLEKDIVDSTYLSLFEQDFFHPKEEDDLENWCWGAGTPILTVDGYKPIEDIQIGDLVYTHDGTVHPVINTMSHFADNCVRIFGDSLPSLICTNDHKLFAKKQGVFDKYPVNDLISQDQICTYDSETGFEFKRGLNKQTAPSQIVYNITVDTNHSYIAGGIVSANCGGNGVMLSCDPDGYLYPCIRYMESSLGTDQKPLRIGHVDVGMAQQQCERDCIHCLQCVNRRTQSTDECFYCPIAEGCSWCSAYNYQVFGTPDKRATYICEMHKARALANVYYWNTYYRLKGMDKRMKMHCPKEWALNIISEEEYESLLKLSEEEKNYEIGS